MPHSTTSTRDGYGQWRCPYCGARLWGNESGREVTCPSHADLPALEPLDDRYLLAVRT